MVDNSNMPHPKCLGSQKNPCTEPKTCEKGPKLGFEYLPTSKTSHCVRTACMAFPFHLEDARHHKQGGICHTGVVMKQRILSYRTPLCHRRPVTAHECSAASQQFQTNTECGLEFAGRLLNVSQAGLGQLVARPWNPANCLLLNGKVHDTGDPSLLLSSTASSSLSIPSVKSLSDSAPSCDPPLILPSPRGPAHSKYPQPPNHAALL